MSRSHHISEQNSAYRRGVVLGLTMAEVGILIVFVLLLLIGVQEFFREEEAKAMEGREAVEVENLRALQRADSVLTELRRPLQLEDSAIVEEIGTLIRALQEVTATRDGWNTLQEVRAAQEEVRRVRDEIKRSGGSETLAYEVEQQSYRIANQEGQLRRYESRLLAIGGGKGERPCWVKPDGTIEYLYDVVLASNGIRMREYHYGHREKERSLLQMPAVDTTETLSPAEFLRRTQPLYGQSVAANCRFFVVIYDATEPSEKDLYKQLLGTVEAHFYKRNDHGQPPF